VLDLAAGRGQACGAQGHAPHLILFSRREEPFVIENPAQKEAATVQSLMCSSWWGMTSSAPEQSETHEKVILDPGWCRPSANRVTFQLQGTYPASLAGYPSPGVSV